MNSNLQLFDFEGNQVRTLEIKNEPWFVGKDVAEILGYKLPTKAIQDHVDAEDKRSEIVKASQIFQNGKGYVNVDLIKESGVYSLIFSSQMSNAKKFKRWVTSEVLPAIRKHGAYMTDEKAFDVIHNKNGLADLLQQAADQLKQKDIQIEEMKPKALFADSVATSNSTILIGELAKILRGNGIDIGATRLFSWMREHGYLINRKGSDWNMPTQRAMDLGLFQIKETTINHANGTTSISKTPKVTGKGQQYFINKFLKGRELVEEG
ncbi:hypothetical protein IMAU30132_00084 [Lactobacillus helveticus]|uniref:phage antirepressor n=1 Tax=Lactobacillus helveticus TaxID=1587 RepID=UPI001562AAD9|nr:phage antirepressor [Lactobacillus helveticus]NRO47734.1 hypothetical protein [Lactobacillus helveticus]